jgi:hypothetical protein
MHFSIGMSRRQNLEFFSVLTVISLGISRLRLQFVEHRKMSDTREDPPVVWGARAIGEIIGRTEREAYYLLEAGHLPAVRVGKKWCAIPSRLRAVLAGKTATIPA